MVYEKAQAEIMEFENTDVITTSDMSINGEENYCSGKIGGYSCDSNIGDYYDYSKEDAYKDNP